MSQIALGGAGVGDRRRAPRSKSNSAPSRRGPAGPVDQELRVAHERHAGSGSSADAVYRALVENIVSGALPSGWHLAEERLAGLFQVSRTPVREALMRLETEGLAEPDRRRGLVVGYVSAQQIMDVYIIREPLEGIAASLAARFGSPIDFAELEQINELMAQAALAQDFTRMASLNIEFHAVLARASRNQMLERFIEDIHRWVQRMPATTLAQPGRAEEAIAEHQRLIASLKASDASGAEELARLHIREALSLRMLMQPRRTPAAVPLANTAE
jgi:DNA-binding GntR family transcriptional regulator